MLREHGAQRPSVFELLTVVHGIRGTKSPFQYTVPPPPPPISPRHRQFQPQFNAQAKSEPQSQSKQPSLSSPPAKPVNAGIQAREKVLEAIAPMRRGRPSHSRNSRPSSPIKTPDPAKMPSVNTEKGASPNWPVGDYVFDADGTKAWQAATKNSLGSSGIGSMDNAESAWKLKDSDKSKGSEPNKLTVDLGVSLWDSFDSSAIITPPKVTTTRRHRSESTGGRSTPIIPQIPKGKDAFADLGLGLSDRAPAMPTLGEARRLRTGLATTSHVTPNAPGFGASNQSGVQSTRPTPSPRPSYLSPPKGQSLFQLQSTTPNTSPSQPLISSRLSPAAQLEGLPTEARFPPLEVLDPSFSVGSPSRTPGLQSKNAEKAPKSSSQSSRRNSSSLRPNVPSRVHDGVRSQHVTGVAMQDASHDKRGVEAASEASVLKQGEISRPVLTRKHRSSLSIKPKPQPTTGPSISGLPPTFSDSSYSIGIPFAQSSPRPTGLDKDVTARTRTPVGNSRSGTPILRGSPGKHASVVERGAPSASSQQQANTALRRNDISPAAKGPKATTVTNLTPRTPPTNITAFNNNPSNPLSESPKPVVKKDDTSSDEGPENVEGYHPSSANAKEKGQQEPRKRRSGRQSSVHDLVDLWGGTAVVSNGPGADVSKRKRKSIPTPSHIPLGSTSQSILAPPVDPLPTSRSLDRSSPLDSGRYREPPSTGSAQSPASDRSRPQSMFIFPMSNSISDGPISPGLSPPTDESKPRAGVRRTSISDMVQRYEAIGGKAKPVPPVLSKPALLRSSPRQPDTNRFPKSPTTSTQNFSRRKASLDASPRLERLNASSPSTNFTNNTTTRASPDMRTHQSSALRTSQVRRLPPEPYKESQNSLPLPQSQPSRRVPASDGSSSELTGSSSVLTGSSLVLTGSSSVLTGSSSVLTAARSPSPKHTVSEQATNTNDGRTSSPEQPYQGVGKLIDQWQRKTAESDIPSSPIKSRRSGVSRKYTGLASSGAGGGR
jgi:AP2-associated kinase